MFSLIMDRIRTENEKEVPPGLDDAVKSELQAWTDSGAFSSINYADVSRANWTPIVHLDHVYNFARAYTMPISAFFNNDDLYAKITASLRYWHEWNHEYYNWWYQQIASPQRLGRILIQMRKSPRRIPEPLETDILERMKTEGGDPADWTGANKTDIALHWLYRACLSNDEALLEATAARLFQAVDIGGDEGIQRDYSYFQHGRQVYTIGYGSDFIKGISFFAFCTAGTPYALPREKLEIVARFFHETFLPAHRGRYALFTVGGRGVLSRRGAAAADTVYAERMKQIDPAHAGVYDDFIKRARGEVAPDWGVTPKHTFYPIGEYTLHIRPGYAFDVRLASKRTGRIEYGNGENLKGYYASDGAVNIALRGDEYADIFPVWNWTRIPGVTCVQRDVIPLPPKEWCVYGAADFAGGLSDSRYGVTAYAYDAEYTGNSAKKAWFFFDDEVVCLGSGINATDAGAGFLVNTTVNQCLLNGDALVSAGGGVSVLGRGERTYPDAPDWVLHGGIGYLFPRGGEIGVSVDAQTGSWRDINRSQSDEMITKNVFALWLNHGENPADGEYAYIVVPGKYSEQEMNDYRRKRSVEIWDNTAAVQAVYHKDLDILGIVFYEPGGFEHGGVTVQSDKACIIMIKTMKTQAPVLHIADPAHTASKITVTAVFPGFIAYNKVYEDLPASAE
jgi:chondroitin AC lyase